MFQFSLKQLLWAMMLIAGYAAIIGLCTRAPVNAWIAGVIFGTLPTVGGLYGLARNNVKGMLLGILGGCVVTFVLILLFLPSVQSARE